jgi:hypothetical protein
MKQASVSGLAAGTVSLPKTRTRDSYRMQILIEHSAESVAPPYVKADELVRFTNATDGD